MTVIFSVLSFPKESCYLCIKLSTSETMTDLHEIMDERCTVGGYPNLIPLNFLKSVLTWQPHELVRWYRH